MKILKEEVVQFESWAKYYWKKAPGFTNESKNLIDDFIRELRNEKRLNPFFHHLMELLPFVFLFLFWILIFFITPNFNLSKMNLFLIIGTLHGIWGYSWVVYTLHEGAGHQLLSNTPFRFMTFHASRILFADPEFYKNAHAQHHKNLGTIEDASFTNFIKISRFLKSLMPGAGILYPNDYKIHQSDQITKSLIISIFVGSIFLFFEIYLLKNLLSWWQSLLSLGLLGPWIGFGLDRLRESIEHWGMPADRQYGSKEFGLGFYGLLLGGGPWGQPCHFSHHLAPDLSWYQQIKLHQFLKNLNEDLPKEFLIKSGLGLKDIMFRFKDFNLPQRDYET